MTCRRAYTAASMSCRPISRPWPTHNRARRCAVLASCTRSSISGASRSCAPRGCRSSSTASRSACAIWASASPMTSWCPPAFTKPMQLHIQHRTTYRYEEPVKYTAQTLRLTPRREGSQRTLSWSIRAPGRRTEQLDAHGNITHLLTLEEPHRAIEIDVRGVVEMTGDEEFLRFDGTLSPLAYLAATPLTAANAA